LTNEKCFDGIGPMEATQGSFSHSFWGGPDG
jgi:hypothetical protein